MGQQPNRERLQCLSAGGRFRPFWRKVNIGMKIAVFSAFRLGGVSAPQNKIRIIKIMRESSVPFGWGAFPPGKQEPKAIPARA